MKITWLFGAVFAGIAANLAVAISMPKVLAAETDVPVTEIRWFNFPSEDGWQRLQFTVPNEDNITFVSGSKLQLYHVHIARMFEISHFLCDRDRTAVGYDWFYEVANGNIEAGKFKISCKLASEISAAYGLEKPQITVIRRNFDRPEGLPAVALEQYSIPTLKITDNKILLWINFVKVFALNHEKSQAKQAESNFPVAQIFKQIKGKTRVPVFLPSQLPLSDIKQLDFNVTTGSHGYSVEMYWGKGCRGGACYFGTIEAKRDEPISPPSQLPNDTYRSIQLDNKIRGTFFNICGAYCTAFVEWRYEGVLYRITIKNGRQQEVVRTVNSAIKAGRR